MDYRSSRPKLYLTSLLPKEVLNMLEKNYEINVHSTRKAPTKEELGPVFYLGSAPHVILAR